MLNIHTIILGLSVFHLCLAMDSIEQQTGKDELDQQVGEHHPLDKLYKRGAATRVLTVDAAMGIYSVNTQYVYLFTGNTVQVLKNSKFFEEKPRKDFHLPDDMHLQAAFVREGHPGKKVYYGDKYGLSVSVRDKVKKRKLKYGRARAFIRKGGPDAVGRRGGKAYVFKGCEVAVRNSWNDWETPFNVTTLGLPCDLEAAWTEREGMAILKDAWLWLWFYDKDKPTGPYPFFTLYDLKDGDTLVQA